MESILKSPFTTIGGLIAIVGAALIAAPLPEKWKWVGPLLASVGAGLIGLAAKDFNTHSTQVEVKEATKEDIAKDDAIIRDIKAKKE